MENKIHKVLALKYRPKNFKELIGQEIMVETITNSIKLNKLTKCLFIYWNSWSRKNYNSSFNC